MGGRGDLHKFMNISCAATTTSRVFQPELCFQLAWHNDTHLSCFPDI